MPVNLSGRHQHISVLHSTKTSPLHFITMYDEYTVSRYVHHLSDGYALHISTFVQMVNALCTICNIYSTVERSIVDISDLR